MMQHPQTTIKRQETRQSIADKYAGERCTLDGKPAKVMGRLNGFATIGQLEGAATAEYSWETVDRIMQGDKAFKS